jgi:hypothetical protein
MNELLNGVSHEAGFLPDGNPARILCHRTDLEKFTPIKNPLLHLRETLHLVIEEVYRAERLRESAQNVPMRKKRKMFRFSEPKLNVDKAFVDNLVKNVEKRYFDFRLSNNDW